MLNVIYSDEFLEHETGITHPESPARLRAIVQALRNSKLPLEWRLPTPLDNSPALDWVKKIHTADYIKTLVDLTASGGGFITSDTPVSPRSYEVALLAVSAWLDAVDLAVQEQISFVAARPPGHHAEANFGMGFCLFANAAIAAHYSLGRPGIERVAILDWDVHHGNGTQHLVSENPRIAFCSLHQSPCYPGTGRATETGSYNNILNLPMSPGSSMHEYQPIFTGRVVPFLTNFQPDLLIVSAGYDAHKDDPLARINLTSADYAFFTYHCRQISPRLMFGLEGGYDLEALSESVVATLEACVEH